MDQTADQGPVERDLGRAESMEAASVQNAVAAGGLAALLAVPVAAALAAIQAKLRKRSARGRRPAAR